MLRHVGATDATVWIETDRACTVDICGTTTSTFHVSGHHYALVVIDGLAPGSSIEYQVHLDGRQCWPPPTIEGVPDLPPSVIRTLPGDEAATSSPSRVLFGSCRTAAPHEPPWSLELAFDERGRGVDAIYAHASRLLTTPPTEWPLLIVLLGDQVYADDSSPWTRAWIDAHRPDRGGMPISLVSGFEEFCWLYHESWAPRIERWFFSVVPSVMIFDDHDMVDDWNISDTWVRDIRRESWWQEHVVGGLVTYWLYQHLGNLSPAAIAQEGMLAELLTLDDGATYLREWARRSENFTPIPGGYRFSFARDIGSIRLVMIDARNGRVLTPGHRTIVDDDEWKWIGEQCRADVDHLLIGTSLPAFVPGGMHDAQVWNEAVCDGAWGRLGVRVGERIRRALDLEDWPAFHRSFTALVDLIGEVGAADRPTAPATISVLSGDIHFSYASRIHLPATSPMGSRVHQLVNSPIRNALTPFERTFMRFAMSRPARLIGRALRRAGRRRRDPVTWGIDRGPVFENCIGVITFDGRHADLTVEQASPDDDGAPQLSEAFSLQLV